MTGLFAKLPQLRELNHDALNSPRLNIVNRDAFLWIEESREYFDFILIDFPDPSNYSLGKLYTSAFYRMLEKHLSANGVAVVQATSPLYARQSFWCIVNTIESVGLKTAPYHAYVPSFGEWGYVAITRGEFVPPARYDVELKFLTPAMTRTLFEFPADMGRVDTEINRLNNQVLLRYFESEWRRVIR